MNTSGYGSSHIQGVMDFVEDFGCGLGYGGIDIDYSLSFVVILHVKL